MPSHRYFFPAGFLRGVVHAQSTPAFSRATVSCPGGVSGLMVEPAPMLSLWRSRTGATMVASEPMSSRPRSRAVSSRHIVVCQVMVPRRRIALVPTTASPM